jgi:hypothetical protein
MKFKMDKQKAFVINVNPRKEAEGEDLGARLATDIKVRCEEMNASELKALCPVDSAAKQSIVEALFNEAGAPRFYGIAAIDLGAVFKDADVRVCGIAFKEAKMKDFRIVKLGDHRKVDLEFTIQVHPTATQVGTMAEKIKRDTDITISPQPELDLEPQEDAEDEGKPPKDKKTKPLELAGGGKDDAGK